MDTEIDKSSVYSATTSLAIYSEQARWARLNNYLVVNSILLVAWATIFENEITAHRAYVLIVLCLPGIILGILWAVLGHRSSQYLDAMHEVAEKLELSVPLGPFKELAALRAVVRKRGKLTSSKILVTWIPIVFSCLYVILAVFSLLYAC